MITKILSATIAALMFCFITVSVAQPQTAQKDANTASQRTKKSTASSQNTKKTVTPAKSAQKKKPATATNKSAAKTAPKKATAKSSSKKATQSSSKKKATAKKATKKTTAKKATKKTTAKKTAVKSQSKNRKQAVAPKTTAKKSPVITIPSVGVKKAPATANANQQQRFLDNPLSKDELKYTSLLSQAQFEYEQNNHSQALAIMHQAYEIKQEQFVAGNIASLYMMMGDAPNCVRMVRKLKLTDPTVIGGLILGLVDRGMLYYAKNVAEITEHLHDNGSIAYSKGVMYERLREPKTAEQYYKRAVMMSGHNPSYVYALARINDVLKNYEKAFTLYEDVLALTRRGDIYIHSVSRLDELRQVLDLDK